MTATSTDGTDTATTTGTIAVSVDPDADAPTLTMIDASGTEDQPISLDISSALTDTDGSETLSVTVAGVPDGAALSAGTDNGDGTWTLDPADLANLTVTPAADSDARLHALTVNLRRFDRWHRYGDHHRHHRSECRPGCGRSDADHDRRVRHRGPADLAGYLVCFDRHRRFRDSVRGQPDGNPGGGFRR